MKWTNSKYFLQSVKAKIKRDFKNVALLFSLMAPHTLFGSRYSRMDQVKFVEDSLKKFEVIWSALADPVP